MRNKAGEKYINIPNVITFVRFFFLPAMWYYALNDRRIHFVVFFLLFGFADALDGNLARRLKQVTEFGSWFDTAVDLVFAFSLFIWIPLLFFDMLRENVALVLITLGVVFVAWGLLFFYKKANPENFHIVSAKFTGCVAFPFFVHALIFGYNQIFFYVLIGAVYVMIIEQTVIILTERKVSPLIKEQLKYYYKLVFRKN